LTAVVQEKALHDNAFSDNFLQLTAPGSDGPSATAKKSHPSYTDGRQTARLNRVGTHLRDVKTSGTGKLYTAAELQRTHPTLFV